MDCLVHLIEEAPSSKKARMDPDKDVVQNSQREDVVRPSYTLEPVYVWRDDAFNLHLLTCKPQGNTVCSCRQSLKEILNRDAPFVLILVYRRNTCLLFVSRRYRLCEDGCFNTNGSDDTEYTVNMEVSLHYGGCDGVTCSCRIVSNNGVMTTVDEGDEGVRIKIYEFLIHLPDCNGESLCLCTKTLLERGGYQLRMTMESNHMMCDSRTKGRTVALLEQIPWPNLVPYNLESLEKTVYLLVSDKALEEEPQNIERGCLILRSRSKAEDRESSDEDSEDPDSPLWFKRN